MVIIKYRYYISLFDNSEFSPSYGINEDVNENVVSFIVRNQKFNGYSKLVESELSLKGLKGLKGKKIIKVRNILLVSAQLFIQESDRVLKIADDDGYLQLKVSTTAYTKLLKHLKIKK